MEWLNLLQWPAMAVTLTAAWLVASKARRRRRSGFWLYLVSNVLWVSWAIATKAWALLILQFGLAAMNIRGERRNQPETDSNG